MLSPEGFKTEEPLTTSHLTGVRAVFFDAVGTLLYPAAPVAITYRHAALRHGVSIEEATIRHRLRDAFVRQEQLDQVTGWRTSEAREVERWRHIVHDTLREVDRPEPCFAELWDWFRNPSAWKTHPETAVVLAELSARGLTLGMASNFDARLAEIVSAKSELQPLATRLVISSLVGWRKPAPEFFAAIMATVPLAAEQILFVGDDRRNDYEGAIAAGMRAVLLSNESTEGGSVTIATLMEML